MAARAVLSSESSAGVNVTAAVPMLLEFISTHADGTSPLSAWSDRVPDLFPPTQAIDQQLEGGGDLATAGIIQMITSEGWTPIGENPDHPAGLDIIAKLI